MDLNTKLTAMEEELTDQFPCLTCGEQGHGRNFLWEAQPLFLKYGYDYSVLLAALMLARDEYGGPAIKIRGGRMDQAGRCVSPKELMDGLKKLLDERY